MLTSISGLLNLTEGKACLKFGSGLVLGCGRILINYMCLLIVSWTHLILIYEQSINSLIHFV
jgi:hypothetical protein